MSFGSRAAIISRTLAAMLLAVAVYLAVFVGASIVNYYFRRYLFAMPRFPLLRFLVVLLYAGAAVALAKAACDALIKSYASKAVSWGFLLLVFLVWVGDLGRWHALRWVVHDMLAQTLAVVYVTLVVF